MRIHDTLLIQIKNNVCKTRTIIIAKILARFAHILYYKLNNNYYHELSQSNYTHGEEIKK